MYCASEKRNRFQSSFTPLLLFSLFISFLAAFAPLAYPSYEAAPPVPSSALLTFLGVLFAFWTSSSKRFRGGRESEGNMRPRAALPGATSAGGITADVHLRVECREHSQRTQKKKDEEEEKKTKSLRWRRTRKRYAFVFRLFLLGLTSSEAQFASVIFFFFKQSKLRLSFRRKSIYFLFHFWFLCGDAFGMQPGNRVCVECVLERFAFV